MKRVFCLFLLSLMIVGLFVTPADYEITDEMIDHFGETLPDEVHYPDLEFPTLNYFPSAEGTVHEDSILEFYETTDDDVLFYPDLFHNTSLDQADGDEGATSGDYTDTFTLDATALRGGSAMAVPDLDVWINTTTQASAGIEGFSYALYVNGVAGGTSDLSMWDDQTPEWDKIADLTGGAYEWVNGTTYDSDYWNDSSICFNLVDANQAMLYVDYIEITFYIMTLADSDHYAESFADVSDWSTPPSGVSGTDDDVGYYDIPGDGAYDYWYSNEISLPAGNYYVEVCAKDNVSAGTGYGHFGVSSGASVTGDTKTMIGGWYRPDEFNTKKAYFTVAWPIVCVYMNYIDASNNERASADYLRIGPADEFGWQHDCSTTEAIRTMNDGTGAQTLTSDDDKLHFVGTSDSYSGLIVEIDDTTTESNLKTSYYPFFEINVNASTSQDIRFKFWDETSTVTYYNDYVETNAFTTARINIDALVAGSYVNQIQIYDHNDGAQDFYVDWMDCNSIANFTLDFQSGYTTSDFAYVDSGTLHTSKSTTKYIKFGHDPALAVTIATHNVWNYTSSDINPTGSTDINVQFYADGAWGGLTADESRGALSGTTLTDIQFYVYSSMDISAIKFWEDATAPTIEEKWSTPQDPDTSDDVTISIVTTDVVGVYEATATPLSEPEGSSVGTQTFTLVDTNPSGAMFWTTTIDDSKLIEGHYIFEIDANDGANSDYEYLAFTVIQESKTTYIRIFDSLGDFVPFETFEVYRNGTRQYTDTFEGDTESAYQIQVKDRWGESLNTTTFSAGDQELVVTVEVYSLKVMSWHYDFVRFNVTRAGLTYSEIVTPLEVINFRLYTNTYDWAIDYLNGTSTSGNIGLTNSTALVVTGSTISDVYGLVNTVNTMTTAINITTTTISNEVVTVQLMFDWSNTTLYNQTINIIAAFNWENTTIYNQTVSIASLFNATNTVLYDQIILIQNMFNWENTTLYNQTISILNAFNATNTVLYSQTVSILADISNVNSTIYAQTVQMLLDLENSNSTLYDQTVTLLANIANVDSDIAAQTVTILADIDNVNSTIYAQTVQMLTDINNINSTIYAQTVMILSNLSDLNATVYLVDDPTHLNPLILGYSLSDDYCDFTIVSTWHNATLSFYDNDVLRAGPTSELLCPIRYPLLSTSGTHNLSVFIDGGNDSFWYNISYTVAEIVAFELEDWDVTPHLGVENYMECFFRTTWENSTIYVYLNDSLQTSVLEQEGGIAFSFWMTGTPGLHQYVFNVTSGANVITITWDFYLPDWAETALVMRWDLWTFQDNYTMLELESNWMNCTYYVYLNSSLVATSANDPVILNFTRTINIGTYNLTIYADGGAQTYTIKNIRYIITEEGVSYDYSTVSGGRSVREGDIIEGDIIEGDTYENPPGIYLTAETAATIAVSTVFIFFLAVLFMNSRVKKAQLDRDKKGNQ